MRLEENIWTDKNGNEIIIQNMSDRYLANAINYCGKKMLAHSAMTDNNSVIGLAKEVQRRLDLIMDNKIESAYEAFLGKD